MSDSLTLWTVAHPALLSMGFSRQEYWSGLPFPSPEYLPDPGIEPMSSVLQADSLPTELEGKLSTERYYKSPVMASSPSLALTCPTAAGVLLWSWGWLRACTLRTHLHQRSWGPEQLCLRRARLSISNNNNNQCWKLKPKKNISTDI